MTNDSERRPQHVVVGEDATEFRLLRAACGDQEVHEWLLSWLGPERTDPQKYIAALEEIGRGWRASAPDGRERVARELETADALVVEREPVDEQLPGQAGTALKTVARPGTTNENTDLAACARPGIT